MQNMDDKSQQTTKKHTLPNTPRVSDKIKEYYEKFGHGRELEKFMRLYSPASSQESQNNQDGVSCAAIKDSRCTHTRSQEALFSNSSSDALELRPSRPLSVSGTANSKSLPNIDVQGQNVCKAAEYFIAKDVIVDINIETEEDKGEILSISTENLETPRKSLKNTTTHTPESVAKSHRRLEWDSLGDIGYEKSMSTSNISILEKSLLKAFFKENNAASEPTTSAQAKTDMAEQRNLEKKQKPEEVHSTPPLASSTLVEPNKKGAKPKQLSKSTSCTSLQEKFEKYAQTSVRKLPSVQSQEIQCSISNSSNTIKEDTATPSSFEYYSSRSSKSITPKSSDNLFEHPFITSITDLLMKRKAVAEKNQQKKQQQYNDICELQTKFQAALDENKENQAYSSTSVSSTTTSCFSLTKKAPELDLGIQLICSLIDAKSVNEKQKKRLIREIVKRLTRLEVYGHTNHSAIINISSSGTSTQQSSDSKVTNLYDSVSSNIINKHKSNMSNTNDATELIVRPITEEQVKGAQEKKSTKTDINRKNSKDFHGTEQLTRNVHKLKPKFNGDETHQQIKQSKRYYITQKTDQQSENILKESNTKEFNAATIENEKVKTVQKRESTKQKFSPDRLSTKEKSLSKSHKNVSLTSIYASSSSTSQDLTTQKYVGNTTKNELNNSNNTDAEQPTMREWLNPLTQSEIEYEEKKREENRKKAAAAIQKEKCLKKSKRHDCGRVQQLNWIENEIKRLECLKHLLLKDVTTDKNSTKDSTRSEKLYDTVYSDKSSVLSESAERLVQEIEIILEESHEDVVNIKENLKKSRDRTKETQVVYEKESGSENNTKKVAKPKFRTIKETINISEEQLLNGNNEKESEQIRQRKKIDTPSTEKSQESESLKDMVQQRKKEFMKAYKTKKQHHYEALKQQQQKDFKYLNLQRAATATTGSEHYSVPRTMPRTFSANELSYAYTQNPLPLTPTVRELKSQNHNAKPVHVIYSTAAAQQPPKKPINVTASTTTTTTSSSTSMLCISSDVSVPMGSCNTSSTSTTTHQYDDVAAAATQIGVAIQTSDSMMYTKPIYGPEQRTGRFIPHHFHANNTKSSSACIQVKPKGIAYVIEFDVKNKNNSNSNSTSSSNIKANLKTQSSLSTNIEEANNLKTFLSSADEPQLTLQEHLQKSKPKFSQHSKQRQAILNQLQSMRQERGRQIREIIDNTSFNSLEKRFKLLPPPPTQKVRILNTKAMKALTNKRFTTLPEVVAKQEREVEEKKRRGYRVLRDVFNRRLQNRVHSGKLSLNHSKTVI